MVYRELFYTAQQVEKQSIQLYPDAADYGVPIFSNNDPIIKMVKGIIDQYGAKVKTINYLTGSDQTIEISGYDEGTRSEKLVTFTFTYTYTKVEHRDRDMRKSGRIGHLNVQKS